MTPPKRAPYVTDLTDEQWREIEPLLPAAKPGGRPRKVDLREVVNALLFINRTGCQWRMIPHDFPPKSTVWNYYSQWRKDGTFDRIVETLRGKVREQQSNSGAADPSLAVVDAQSVKTTEMGGPERGYDVAKKVKGRKRHIATDALGMLLVVVVTAASVLDAKAAKAVFRHLDSTHQPRLELVVGDSAYNNHSLKSWIESNEEIDWELSIVPTPRNVHEFVALPIRWIVERTFSWINRCRRCSKDYERSPDSSRAMVQLSQIRLMLRRLHPSAPEPPFKYRDTR